MSQQNMKDEYWSELYLTKNKEYQIAKNEVYNSYVVPVLKENGFDPNEYNWRLDFASATIYLTKNKGI